MFSVGDKVVYPMHGAGTIQNIEEKSVLGETRAYYILRIPYGRLQVMVPVVGSDAAGLRPIVTKEKIAEVRELLSAPSTPMDENWNRRYRENMIRIKSGNLLEVARVIKGLMARDAEKGLSTGERKMLRSAKQILISEVVLAKDCDYDEVEQQINRAMV